MTLGKQIIGLSIIAIAIAGCGNANTLSERKSTGTASNTDTSDAVNYVIQAKSQALTSAQKNILRIHNERRSNDFSDSDLSYSLELEKVAQDYANVLAKSGKQEHDPDNAKNGYGENLFANSNNPKVRIEEAMIHWYDNEKRIYSYDTNECNTSGSNANNDAALTCGHYTQVAWQDTKEVGCASAPYTNPTSLYFGGSVYICRYKEAGNRGTEKPYCTNYATNDIYTGTIPTINTRDISAKNLEIELVSEDRIKCTRTDNRNGAIKFSNDFKSAQLLAFSIFNEDKYTVNLNFDDVEIVDNMVKLKGTGLAEEKYPIFMNIEFVGETNEYYGVELEWNGHNKDNKTLTRHMKAKLYK